MFKADFGMKDDVCLLSHDCDIYINTIIIKTEVNMKRTEAVLANWVIELRDGSLQVQRAFPFAHEADLVRFMEFVGKFMKCPSMTVVTSSATHPEPVAIVRMELLPERKLLSAAGEIAVTCEREYASILSHADQSAAA